MASTISSLVVSVPVSVRIARQCGLADRGRAEMKAALLASLRAKAASLEEDRWMFEREDGVPS